MTRLSFASIACRATMAGFLVCAALGASASAQVPPDVAAGVRAIGPTSETPNTAKLFAPLLLDKAEPYAGVKVARDEAYGPDPLNRLDVFTPTAAGAERPVLVFVHGGGFRNGDKREPAAPPFFDNIMMWAARQGMVGVNLNYRLAPQNKWPAAHEDFAAALRWVRANIGRFGGDPDRIFIMGQSAGASVVSGYVAYPKLQGPEARGVKAAIMLSGIYDERILKASPYFADVVSDPELNGGKFSVEGLKKAKIPLFVSSTEVDTPMAVDQTAALKKALCDAGRCPATAVFKDHSHFSQVFSFDTSDVSVSGPVGQFIRSVK